MHSVCSRPVPSSCPPSFFLSCPLAPTVKTSTNPLSPLASPLLLALLSHTTQYRSSNLAVHQESPAPERKPRKSVAFSEGTTIVDSNGQVTEMNGAHGDKDSAAAHSGGKTCHRYTPTETASSPAVGATTTPHALTLTPAPDAVPDNDVDEMSAMFEGLAKKKKKSKSKTDAADGDDAPAADAEFDPSALKKKKKKKVKSTDADDFEAKLAEAGAADKDDAEQDAPASKSAQHGDMDKGTGIWQHNDATPIEYPLLLTRFFSQLQLHNPDLASSGSKSYKIPPPQCLREGNKKTIFANIAEICKRMKRTDEHVTQFLFAELGTSGSVDGSRRLVIKGRFQQKQIENVLRRYIGKFNPPSIPSALC